MQSLAVAWLAAVAASLLMSIWRSFFFENFTASFAVVAGALALFHLVSRRLLQALLVVGGGLILWAVTFYLERLVVRLIG